MYERQVFTHLPNGTVCVFRGSYRLRIIPPYSVYETKKEPPYSTYMLPVSSGHIPLPATTNGKNLWDQNELLGFTIYDEISP